MADPPENDLDEERTAESSVLVTGAAGNVGQHVVRSLLQRDVQVVAASYWSEVTAALTAALGRPIRYEAASVIGYMLHLSRRGLPLGAITVQTILHFLLRFGQGATEDPTLERLLGRPGRSIRRYIEDYAELWARPDSDSPSRGAAS